MTLQLLEMDCERHLILMHETIKSNTLCIYTHTADGPGSRCQCELHRSAMLEMFLRHDAEKNLLAPSKMTQLEALQCMFAFLQTTLCANISAHVSA